MAFTDPEQSRMGSHERAAETRMTHGEGREGSHRKREREGKDRQEEKPSKSAEPANTKPNVSADRMSRADQALVVAKGRQAEGAESERAQRERERVVDGYARQSDHGVVAGERQGV